MAVPRLADLNLLPGQDLGAACLVETDRVNHSASFLPQINDGAGKTAFRLPASSLQDRPAGSARSTSSTRMRLAARPLPLTDPEKLLANLVEQH
jgi:hypothetical protein